MGNGVSGFGFGFQRHGVSCVPLLGGATTRDVCCGERSGSLIFPTHPPSL